MLTKPCKDYEALEEHFRQVIVEIQRRLECLEFLLLETEGQVAKGISRKDCQQKENQRDGQDGYKRSREYPYSIN